MPRRLLVLLVPALLLLHAAPSAAQAPLPAQGVYESCQPIRLACDQRLDDIAVAGFDLVLNYALLEGRPRDIKRYAQRAQRVGLQLIVPLNHKAWRRQQKLADAYPRLARACSCGGHYVMRRYALRMASRLPAIWGWYVGDELRGHEAGSVASLGRGIRAVDPVRPRLYVTFRDRGPAGTSLPLDPFAPFAEVLGYATYPIGYGPRLDLVQTATEEARSTAEASGGTAAAVLQAFDWRRYGVTRQSREPTYEELRAMRDYAVTGGAELILWYSWHDVLRASNPQRALRDLREAAFGP